MKRQTALSLALLSVVSLTACTKTEPDTATTGDTTVKTEEKGPETSKETGKEPAKTSAASEQKPVMDLPQVADAMKVIRSKPLGDEVVICYVEGQPITMGTYRRQLKTNLQKFQDTMAMDPGVIRPYLAEARRRGMTLNQDERAKLVEAAKVARGTTPDKFREFLKSGNMTEADFDKLILEEALANKMFRTLQEEGLLDSLVDHELFLAEARARGYSQKAFNNYMELKDSEVYPRALKQSGLSPELYRDDIVNNFMVVMAQDKIITDAPVTDEVARKFFDKNKDNFKHGERIRLSQIIIAAPEENIGNIEGIKSQIVRLKPNISPTELDEAMKAKKAELANKAESILKRAQKGEDFKLLANENTDDLQARTAKTGGDAGFVEVSMLTPAVKQVVENLKAGEVAGKVIPIEIGYVITKVTERQPAGPFTYAEVKDFIMQKLREPNAKAALDRWVNARRKSARIELSQAMRSELKDSKPFKSSSAAVP
jgi:peptidyl-prolyl cis-trans isomerase C